MPSDFLDRWHVNVQKQHDILITYLRSKVDAGDWRAVADAAADLRECEAQFALIDALEDQPDV